MDAVSPYSATLTLAYATLKVSLSVYRFDPAAVQYI